MSDKEHLKEFQPGEKVEWNSASGRVIGTVEEKLTEPTMIKGHKVAASEENPEYRVHSDKTGAPAAHKPEALTSLDRPGEEESGQPAESEIKNRKRDREEKTEEEAEKKEEKLTEEAQAKQKDESKSAKKARLDEEKAAQAPAEERRQEQAAANE